MITLPLNHTFCKKKQVEHLNGITFISYSSLSQPDLKYYNLHSTISAVQGLKSVGYA